MTEIKPKTFNEAANAIGLATAQLVALKQSAYGPKNILNCPVGAELGIAVRLYDKIARLVHLSQTNSNPTWESLSDTADDIIGYGIVLKLVLNKEFELPLEETPPF